MTNPARNYDLGEFAGKLAAAFGQDRPDTISISQSGEIKTPAGGEPGAVALPSDQREGAWELRWPNGPKIYGYMVRASDDPDLVEITLLHPAFHESLKYEATMKIRHDLPMPQIIHAMNDRRFMRVDELGHKSRMIKSRARKSVYEIETADYRRAQLDRLWGVLSGLDYRHPLHIDEISIPHKPEDFGEYEIESVVLSYTEGEYGLDDTGVAFCLGYLYSFLDNAQSEGIIEEFYEAETWQEALLFSEEAEEAMAYLIEQPDGETPKIAIEQFCDDLCEVLVDQHLPIFEQSGEPYVYIGDDVEPMDGDRLDRSIRFRENDYELRFEIGRGGRAGRTRVWMWFGRIGSHPLAGDVMTISVMRDMSEIADEVCENLLPLMRGEGTSTSRLLDKIRRRREGLT